MASNGAVSWLGSASKGLPAAPASKPLPAGPAKSSKGGNRGRGAQNQRGGIANPLYDPSQTLTGKALQRAASQIAGAQVNGPISLERSQMAQNTRTNQAGQAQDFSYYMQLAQAAKDAVGRAQQGSQQLGGQLSGIAANTQAQLGQLGQSVSGGPLANMQAQGLDGGQTQALVAQTAQQQGIGALNAQTFEQHGAQQAASQLGQLGTVAGAVPLRGTEQIGQLARAGVAANEPLTAKIAALQASRGALTGTALGQLRTSERNYQIAQQGLGVKNSTLKLTAAQDLAKNTLTQRGQNITNSLGQARIKASDAQAAARNLLISNGQDITKARDAANAAYHQAIVNGKYGAGAGAKPLSPSLNSKALSQLSTAIGVIHQGQAYRGTATNPMPKGYTEAQIRSGLGQKYHIPDYLIQAAYELVGYGGLTGQTASYLHSIGLRGGTYNGTPIKVLQSKTGGAISSAASSRGSGLPQTPIGL